MSRLAVQRRSYGLMVSLILLPLLAVSGPLRRDLVTLGKGYDIFHGPLTVNGSFGPVPPRPPPEVTGVSLIWTHMPVSNSTFDDITNADYRLQDTANILGTWLKTENVIVRTPTVDSPGQCLGGACSSNADCAPIYKCLFGALSQNDNEMIGQAYGQCITNNSQAWVPSGNSPWQCLFNLSQTDQDPLQRSPCSGQQYDLTQDNWRAASVDENLQVALQGGSDSLGVFWSGRSEDQTFSQSLGWQLWGEHGVQCTLENPCKPALKCDEIGSQTAVSGGTSDQVLKSPWAFLATSAIKNINQQLWNQWNELQNAIESLALDTFNIDDFFPKKGQNFDLLESLSGLSTLLSIVGGFVPVVGPAISAAGAIASGTATFLSDSVASQLDPLFAQKTFADKVLEIYKALLSGMDDAVTELFNGESIGGTDGSFNITDMMKDGTWVNPQSLTNVSDINQKVRWEILSRSIDSLWKTFSSNKIWVIFNDLAEVDRVNNPKCVADTTGPQSLKYCADGGVYYAYNFIEKGSDAGGVGYPWGADVINDKLQIDPAVRRH